MLKELKLWDLTTEMQFFCIILYYFNKLDFLADGFAMAWRKLQTDRCFLHNKAKRIYCMSVAPLYPICPEFSQGLVAKFIKKDTHLGLFYTENTFWSFASLPAKACSVQQLVNLLEVLLYCWSWVKNFAEVDLSRSKCFIFSLMRKKRLTQELDKVKAHCNRSFLLT